MEFHDGGWVRKSATLSDKTARSEYGLAQDEIFAAIDAAEDPPRTRKIPRTRTASVAALPSTADNPNQRPNGSGSSSRTQP